MNKPRQKPAFRRPKVFVGSSAESLDVAYAIQENLERDAEITVWPQGVFDLSRTTIQSLTKTLIASDFGIFVFAPNDALRLRKKTYAAVRDNVVFELGMFVGRLGVERTFIVVPRNSEELRILTDLIGITPGDYDADRDAENLTAALGPVCNKIRRAIKALKSIKRPTAKKSKRRTAGIVIQEAQYGAGNTWINVTKAVRKQVRMKGQNVRVDNKLGGDPARGIPKNLRLKFSIAGKQYKSNIPEGRYFSLPGKPR
jgi:hypothetical protein